MRRELPGGFELDDDPSRLDLDAVWGYLSSEAYWGRERSREDVEGRSGRLRGWSVCIKSVCINRSGRFARVLSDGRLAYLADVYVLAEHRGLGLGVELVRAAVEEGPHRHLRWLLHTRDAHGLYAKFGFGPPDDRLLERPPPGEGG